SDHAQRERHPRLRRKDGVAADEDEPQHFVVDRLAEVLVRRLERSGHLERSGQLLMLPGGELAVAYAVDRLSACHGHEPGARVVRNARLRPLLQGGDQRILGEVLRAADVADHARQPGDDARGLHAPYGLDGPLHIVAGHGFTRLSRRTSHSSGFGPTNAPSFTQTVSTGRTSMENPTSQPICAAGCREAISTACSRSSASIRKYEPTTSLASATGPSVTVWPFGPGRMCSPTECSSEATSRTLPVAMNFSSWTAQRAPSAFLSSAVIRS